MTSDKYDGGGDNQFEDDLNEYSIQNPTDQHPKLEGKQLSMFDMAKRNPVQGGRHHRLSEGSDELQTIESQRKKQSHYYKCGPAGFQNKVKQLSQTTSLLNKKVTGVNFYMKDIAQAGQRFRQNKTAQGFTIETNVLHMGTEKSLEEAI